MDEAVSLFLCNKKFSSSSLVGLTITFFPIDGLYLRFSHVKRGGVLWLFSTPSWLFVPESYYNGLIPTL